jgi:hypothetical protein
VPRGLLIWVALPVVLALALVARLSGLHWDGLAALHPDERHVLFVTQEAFAALADPAHAGLTLAEWWFSDQSPLNPHLGPRSYVYGEAPLLAGVLLGWALGVTDWFAAIPLMRGLASVVDVLAALAVFLGARLLAGNRAALVAAVLYAAMPSALQLSKFHTVDVWLSAAVAGALVPMLALALGRWGRAGPLALAALAGGFLGLAVASKVPGVLALAPLVVALGLAMRHGMALRTAGFALLLALGAALVVFRLTNPFAFAGGGGAILSPDWIEDFRGLADVTTSADFPPNWQWMAGYGLLRFLRDYALFGVGPVAALLVLGFVKGAPRAALVPLSCVAVFTALAFLSSVSALRYAAPALPALAMALAPVIARLDNRQALGVLALALFWGAGVVRLHDGWHPRIVASHWLWSLPRGTVLTNETAWDDTLPTILRIGDEWRWPTHDDWFVHQSLDITAPDTPEKADRIAALLARTDLLILSSDRQSAVMPRLPERFPLTTEHYRALFAGEACFVPVLELDRGFPLPLFGFDDSWAQEPWRVYDHPAVRIFAREPCFDPAAYAARLRAALEE